MMDELSLIDDVKGSGGDRCGVGSNVCDEKKDLTEYK